MAAEPDQEDLERIIAASPARALPGAVHVIRAEPGMTLADGDLAIVQDDTETTLVTASPERVEAARGDGRPIEGPFGVVRLEITIPFAGPGFIAAATTACAAAGINCYVISTFSFDYLLVPAEDGQAALAALSDIGFPVTTPA
jgi:hypothetical protein